MNRSPAPVAGLTASPDWSMAQSQRRHRRAAADDETATGRSNPAHGRRQGTARHLRGHRFHSRPHRRPSRHKQRDLVRPCLTMRGAQVDRDLLMRASDDGQPCEVHSNVRQRRRACRPQRCTFLQRARSGRTCSARASAADRAVAAQGELASQSRLSGSPPQYRRRRSVPAARRRRRKATMVRDYLFL